MKITKKYNNNVKNWEDNEKMLKKKIKYGEEKDKRHSDRSTDKSSRD